VSLSPDPFTQVERAIWQVLEAHTGFAALVKANNRVNFANPSGSTDPVRDSLQTSDMPEVMILPTNASPSNRRSSGPGLTQSFNLVITSGDARTHAKLNPVKWAAWSALERLNDQLKDRCPFVAQVNTGSFADGFSTGEQPERGPRGWNSVLQIDVVMVFAHEDLAQ